MTKTSFLIEYKKELTSSYSWAQDEAKLTRFLESCAQTINGPNNTWNHDGDCVTRAWKAIGGKGKPTLKALRALA